jgi:hypothetical protein
LNEITFKNGIQMIFLVKKWKLRLLFASISIFWFLPATLWPNGPWVPPRGEFTTRFDISYIPAYEELYINEDGPFPTERKVTDATLQIFSELGMYNDGSLALIIPLKRVEAGGVVEASNSTPLTSSGNLMSTGNVSLTWKQALLKSNTRISGQVMIEFPTATYDAPTGLRSGYDALSVFPSISIGTGSDKYYYFAYLGYGYRTNKYSGFLKNGVEGGYRITRKFWFAAVLDLLYSFEDGDRIDPQENLLTGLYVNDQEYLAWGIKLFGDLGSSWGISAAIYGAVSGNLVPKSPALNIGLYYRLK